MSMNPEYGKVWPEICIPITQPISPDLHGRHIREAIAMPSRAYLSLGSNIGDRQGNVRAAIDRLGTVGTVSAVSSLYETEPVELTEQPWFVNCVVALDTAKPPRELLAALLAIELAMGRRRTQQKGPRTIDLDILLYGDEVVHEPGLTIPHPALAERRFVLEPLVEIAPDLVHPVLRKSIRRLRDELPAGQAVRRVEESGPPAMNL
jgi:2-amino-4-hydroxy-6-hydroxymethyldihydropteridine diphosphokinase